MADRSTLTRRECLSGLSLLAGLNIVRPAFAIGEGSKLRIAQIRYNGNWDPRPMFPLVLAQEMRFRTSVDVQLKRHVLGFTDKRLYQFPLALLLGDGRIRLSNRERIQLKKWIEAGGFLFVDNTGRGEPSTLFDAGIRNEIAAIFPGKKFKKISPQHVLYRSFYVLNFPAGRAIRRTFLEGLFIGERLAILYSQNDLSGALDRDTLGDWTFDVVPGGEAQREKAKRLGINMVLYAMCLDYKDDQVHQDYLLHERNWRIKPPRIE
jgi:hypothetical protein